MPWWQDTYKYAKLVLSLVAKIDRLEAKVKALEDEVKRLSDSLQDVIFERQRDRDSAEHEREMTQIKHELPVSRLEVKLLTYERGLLPPANSEDVL